MASYSFTCREPTASHPAVVPTLAFQFDPYSLHSPCRTVYVISQPVSPATTSAPTSPTTASPNPSLGGRSMTGQEAAEFFTAHCTQPAAWVRQTCTPPRVGTLHATLADQCVPFVPYPSVAEALRTAEGSQYQSPLTGGCDASMVSPQSSAFGDRAVTAQFRDEDFEALLATEDDREKAARLEEERALEARKRAGCRLFLGQLPLYVTGQQVAWIVETVTGCTVFGTEAIHSWGKHQVSGATAPHGKKPKKGSSTTAAPRAVSKGCVHTYCDTEAEAQRIVSLLGSTHRVLVDDTGIFIATSAEELASLFGYCGAMAADVRKRFPLRPFRPVVAQIATSTFVPVTTPPSATVAPDCPTPLAPPCSGGVQAPPPYYSCAVQRMRQEATLPPVPRPLYDVRCTGPAPSYIRQRK